MPRYNLTEARVLADLTQEELADAIKADRKAVNAWERGDVMPQPGHRRAVRRELNNEDLHLFVNYPAQGHADVTHDEGESSEVAVLSPSQEDKYSQLPTSEQLSTTCQEEPNRAIVESADPPSFVIHIPGSVRGFGEFMELVRRQFLEVAAKLGLTASFGGLSLGLVSSPSVDPEEYLSQSHTSIDACWGWLNQGRYQKVERALSGMAPVLKRLAYTISPFQCMAANLAMQAKFMQKYLASQNLNIVESEIHCVEAVRFGVISGDRAALAAALAGQGNTYTVCYHDPQRAIPLLHEALSYLDDETSLTRSLIYSNLSLSYAQDKTREDFETKARDYAELAHMTMPEYPELDAFSQLFLRWNRATLKSLEGKTCLYLARHLPDRDYAQKAYTILDEPASDSTSEQVRGGALIKKADAARLLDGMRESVGCLEEGLPIWRTLRRYIEASDVISNMPPEWKQERSVQDLQKEITHALVLARQ